MADADPFEAGPSDAGARDLDASGADAFDAARFDTGSLDATASGVGVGVGVPNRGADAPGYDSPFARSVHPNRRTSYHPSRHGAGRVTHARAIEPRASTRASEALRAGSSRADAASDARVGGERVNAAPPTLTVTVWGARGSLPASGPQFDRYGGATCAVEIAMGAGGTHDGAIVLDAGTGIVAMGEDLRRRGVREIDLFFSHLHYDHVMGLPFFAPAHDPATTIRVHYGGADTADGVREAIGGFFREPYFPAPLTCMGAAISFHPLRESEPVALGEATLTPRALNHPGGAQGFRIERAGASFAYVTDFEHDGGAGDEAVLALSRKADLALVDATYAPGEYEGCRGWGHAHWRAAADLATRAGARSFGLFHHRHDRTDDEIAAIEAALQTDYPNGFAARGGQRVEIDRALASEQGAVRVRRSTG